jgi:hypothetical protein
MKFPTEKTVYIGARQSFLDRLARILQWENAVVAHIGQQMVGSHTVMRSKVILREGLLYMDDDTLLGTSLSGPPHLVDRIALRAFGVTAYS